MIVAILSGLLFYIVAFIMARAAQARARGKVLGIAAGVAVLTFIVMRAVPGLTGLLMAFPALAVLIFFGLALGCGVEYRRTAGIVAVFVALDVALWFLLNRAIAASV